MVETVYLLRHAQSVGNVHGYDVENADRLTARGRRQAEELVDALSGVRIERVVCSPVERTRHTIRPYLRATGDVAGIWGELQEACWQTHEDGVVGERRFGPAIEVPDDEGSEFEVTSHERPPSRRPENESYVEGLDRVRSVKTRLQRGIESTDTESMLLVGHGQHLPRLCELLLQVEPDGPKRFSFDNLGITKLNRQDSSELRYRVRYSNRNPLVGDI